MHETKPNSGFNIMRKDTGMHTKGVNMHFMGTLNESKYALYVHTTGDGEQVHTTGTVREGKCTIYMHIKGE